MDLRTRRRALMAHGGGAEEKNEIDHINAGSGVVISMDSATKNITLTTATTGGFGYYFKNAIQLVAGDVVKIKSTKISGTAPTFFSGGFLNGSKAIYTNTTFGNTMGKEYSTTLSSDMNLTYLWISNATGTRTGNITYRFSLWVNDVLVIGEG